MLKIPSKNAEHDATMGFGLLTPPADLLGLRMRSGETDLVPTFYTSSAT